MTADSDRLESRATLRRWLETRGYELVSSIGPDPKAFGDVFDRLSRESVTVELRSDRAIWDIAVGVTGDVPRPLRVWAVCLDLGVVPPEPSETSLDRQVEWLRSNMPAIEVACHPYRVEMTRECLDLTLRVLSLASFITLPLPDSARDIPER